MHFSGSLSEAAAACLGAREAADKVALTVSAIESWRLGVLEPEGPQTEAKGCTCGHPRELRLVHPLKVPRRKLTTTKGRKAAIHALAHIEFNAINLAWDCVYRYAGMPWQFYDDWVRVAGEETFHFCLLSRRLEELGSHYGELPAHNGLWEMAEKTKHDLAVRMAMVPRFLEARGLDVTPAMIERFRQCGDATSAAILETILRDEIDHVAVGSRWFRYACSARAVDPDAEFERAVATYTKGKVKGPLEIAHRRSAGFSEAELRYLEAAVGRNNGS